MIEGKFTYYDTAEECATAAAPIFQANNWEWKSIGKIPSESEILEHLLELQKIAIEGGSNFCTSGRIIFENGRFGHYKARVFGQKDRKTRRDSTFTMVRKFGTGEFTTKEFRDFLKQNGIERSKNSVESSLSLLKKAGRLTAIRKGIRKFYSLK